MNEISRNTKLINGKKTFYLESGSGPVLLLLHPWGGSGEVFIPLIQILSSKFRLIAPDLPGCGTSEPLGINESYENLSKFVEDFIINLKLKSVKILGVSFGGAVSLFFAAKNPHMVEKLMVQSPAVNIFRILNFKDRFLIGLALKHKRIRNIIFSLAKSRLNLAITCLEAPRDKLKYFEEMYWHLIKCDNNSQIQMCKEMTHRNIHQIIKKIKVPLFVVCGGNEVGFKKISKKVTSEVSGAKYQEIPGVTHRLYVYESELFAPIIINFFKD